MTRTFQLDSVSYPSVLAWLSKVLEPEKDGRQFTVTLSIRRGSAKAEITKTSSVRLLDKGITSTNCTHAYNSRVSHQCVLISTSLGVFVVSNKTLFAEDAYTRFVFEGDQLSIESINEEGVRIKLTIVPE